MFLRNLHDVSFELATTRFYTGSTETSECVFFLTKIGYRCSIRILETAVPITLRTAGASLGAFSERVYRRCEFLSCTVARSQIMWLMLDLGYGLLDCILVVLLPFWYAYRRMSCAESLSLVCFLLDVIKSRIQLRPSPPVSRPWTYINWELQSIVAEAGMCVHTLPFVSFGGNPHRLSTSTVYMRSQPPMYLCNDLYPSCSVRVSSVDLPPRVSPNSSFDPDLLTHTH